MCTLNTYVAGFKPLLATRSATFLFLNEKMYTTLSGSVKVEWWPSEYQTWV